MALLRAYIHYNAKEEDVMHIAKGHSDNHHSGPFSAAAQMTAAAEAVLESLDHRQRQRCLFAVDDSERLNWDYRPRHRAGLALGEMNSAQRLRALALVASGLSRDGNITALNIMSLEDILGQIEGDAGSHLRDPLRYHLSIFDTPSSKLPWGWRFEGHHISLNFLLSAGRISCCPQFFGANPARVPIQQLNGFRTLPREEETARKLLRLLDDDQLPKALVSNEAPPDIITGWAPSVRLDDPKGVAVSEMNDEQRHTLVELLTVYLGRMAPEIVDTEMDMVDKAGIGNIHFAWAGSKKPGNPHYYRLHGPDLVVEYDNVQNEANHIHSVWRSLRREWGRDLLREHYAGSHHSR